MVNNNIMALGHGKEGEVRRNTLFVELSFNFKGFMTWASSNNLSWSPVKYLKEEIAMIDNKRKITITNNS